jgi:hypothetical protein
MKRYLFCAVLLVPCNAFADEALTRDAAKTLRQAVDFFRKEVSTQGGYLWRYSADLKLREGEGKATATQAWVQPPGTPSVGEALLNAYHASGEAYLLEAATETALALVRCQLVSGGWDYRIEFDPKLRSKYSYRVDSPKARGNNITTLDDNTTQQALRFLMRIDRTLKFKNEPIHDAVQYALDCLMKAQYPNGAMPQRYSEFPDPAKHPVKKASFPASWSRTWPSADYRGYYTFNDNSLADYIDVLFEAAATYEQDRYREAARRAGDFILLAQLPDPQPGWAQQYNFDMQPAWARKFEPPSITGGESRNILRTLLRLYRETGDKKYLEPMPRALAFYRSVRIPGGGLARFYELETSKPLYFTRDYQLTYKDDDLPTHYGFKISDWTDSLAREYEQTLKQPKKKKYTFTRPSGPPSASLIEQTKSAIAALDQRGAWLEPGKLRSHDDASVTRIITTTTFIRNIRTLSAYLGAARKP